MIETASGIMKAENTDNVNKEFFNANYDVVDVLLQRYVQEVDLTSKDAATGVYKIISYKRRADATLYLKCTLSNPDANGFFQTDTWQYYDTTGLIVIKTVVWTLVYDVDGIVTSATPSV